MPPGLLASARISGGASEVRARNTRVAAARTMCCSEPASSCCEPLILFYSKGFQGFNSRFD